MKSAVVPAGALIAAVLVFAGSFAGGRALRPERSSDAAEAAMLVEAVEDPVAVTTSVPGARGPEPSRVVTTTASPTTTTTVSTTTWTTLAAVLGVCDPENTRSARLAGGRLFLEGEIPAVEVGEAIVAKAAAVIGPENVINNYMVVRGTPVPDCAPLLVEDQVLFEFGSSQLRVGFEPLLGLALRLMEQNPAVEITIVAHTDSIGSDAFNQRLSDARTLAIHDWLIDHGADAGRLTQIGKGETEPIASNLTEEGRGQNRRAEFQVRGLLAG